MDEHRQYDHYPISPLSSAVSNPNSTQLPTSFKLDLLELRSSEEIKGWLDKYNRRNIPIMEDELVCEWLLKDITTTGLVNERELISRMNLESSRTEKDSNSAKTFIALAGQDLLDTDEQRHNMIEGLHGPTVYSYGRLLGCMASLVEQVARRNNNPKSRRRPRSDCERTFKQPQRPSRPSRPSRSSRPSQSALNATEVTHQRSEDIPQQPQRRSTRIEKLQRTKPHPKSKCKA